MSREVNADDAAGGRGENPFSTRFVRPGAIAYQFANGDSAASLVDRFFAAGRRGQLVGPHGAGKSTLLKISLAELAARGEVVEHHELHDGQRSLAGPVAAVTSARAPKSIVVVDGYEQLSYWSRLALAHRVARDGLGLLITTHRAVWLPVRLPVLAEVRPSVETAVRIATQLLAQHGDARTAGGIRPADVERIFFEVDGDMRELFFRLYDLYESQRS